MSKIKKSIKDIIGYIFSAWIILFLISLGLGFLFGPDIAYYFPDWYLNILLLGFLFIILIACVQGIFSKIQPKKETAQNIHQDKYDQMDICKNPDLDFDEDLPGWARNIAKRRKARRTSK